MKNAVLCSFAVVVILLACSFDSRAQDQDSPAQDQDVRPGAESRCVIGDEVPSVCFKEFGSWWAAERQWREWMDLHRNRFTSSDGPQKKRPSPPAWLVDYCAGTTDADLKSPDLCPRFNVLKDFDPRQEDLNRQVLIQLRGERVHKTRWLQHIHLDGPWSASQWPSSVYGVIGLHAAMEIEGRFEIFLAPGVLLFTLSDSISSKRWSPAWDYGGGIRLFDFKFPGMKRTATLHFNLAKAWTLDGVIQGIDVMGLSMTFKPPPAKKP